MTDLNYAIAVIHKRTKSMALKNAITKTFNIKKNNLWKYNEKDVEFATSASRHWSYFTENDALGAALFLIYGRSNYSDAHKLLEVALYDNPDSCIGKLLLTINNHESDPVKSNLLEYLTEKIESKELNTLLANYSLEKGSIPDSMEFFLESIKNDDCKESRNESLKLLKSAAKKFFKENKFKFNSSLFEEHKKSLA
jgi:hypothetical protein